MILGKQITVRGESWPCAGPQWLSLAAEATVGWSRMETPLSSTWGFWINMFFPYRSVMAMYQWPMDFQRQGEVFLHLRGMSMIFLILDILRAEADCHISLLSRGGVRLENKCWWMLRPSWGKNWVVMMTCQPTPSPVMKNKLLWFEWQTFAVRWCLPTGLSVRHQVRPPVSLVVPLHLQFVPVPLMLCNGHNLNRLMDD